MITNTDRFVAVTRRTSGTSAHPEQMTRYYQVVLHSENPHDHSKTRTYKEFIMDYETENELHAFKYAYRLAECLECRMMER